MNQESEQRDIVINEAIYFFRQSRINFGELLNLVQSLRIQLPEDKTFEPLAKVASQEVAKGKTIISDLEKGNIKSAIAYLEPYIPELPSEKFNNEITQKMREIRRVYYKLKQFDTLL